MKKYIYFAVAALVMTFAACSSSNDDGPTPTPNQPVEVNLVKSHDFALSSNGKQIAGTVATRGYGDAATPVDILANILYNKSNVEANLSMLTYKSGEGTGAESTYYASKLSVHVRGNVGTTTVTIPVPATFWANVRSQSDWTEFSTEISTALVKMNAKYAAQVDGQNLEIAVSHASDAITITLTGVTADVLDYCKTTYGDGKVNCGMTFEIWTYYNKKDGLQALLNGTTVAFQTAPAAFINSFGKTYNFATQTYSNTANPDDCTVKANGTSFDNNAKTDKLALGNSLYTIYTTDAYWTEVEAEINAAANYDK